MSQCNSHWRSGLIQFFRKSFYNSGSNFTSLSAGLAHKFQHYWHRKSGRPTLQEEAFSNCNARLSASFRALLNWSNSWNPRVQGQQQVPMPSFVDERKQRAKRSLFPTHWWLSVPINCKESCKIERRHSRCFWFDEICSRTPQKTRYRLVIRLRW